jgi:hypothetical protein
MNTEPTPIPWKSDGLRLQDLTGNMLAEFWGDATEKMLTNDQKGAYVYTLIETTGYRDNRNVWLALATASQRAEAFGLTLNLWNNDDNE